MAGRYKGGTEGLICEATAEKVRGSRETKRHQICGWKNLAIGLAVVEVHFSEAGDLLVLVHNINIIALTDTLVSMDFRK